jgi:shikimate kinase
MLIFLTGFMGAGKTTAGKKLASLMNYSFIDLDARIENETGHTVPELFRTGEFRFREIETMVLNGIGELQDAVVSCGGGTPCFNDNMTWMKSHGITIYLSMNAGALFHRLAGSRQKRPLLAGKTDVELMEYIVETLKEREYFYRQCHYIVQGENLDVRELLSTIRNGEAQLR